MFREMRRKNQALSQADCAAISNRGSCGTLALAGDDDYPYAVPMSYVYSGEKLYFHCAKSGHKLDAIRRNAKASFCVIDQDQIVAEEFTSYFRSVIVFGRMRILGDDGEKRAAIEQLAAKYAPSASPKEREDAIQKDWAPLCMLELQIEQMSGKQAIELVKRKAD